MAWLVGGSMTAKKQLARRPDSKKVTVEPEPKSVRWNYHERHDGKKPVISDWKGRVQVALRAKLDRALDQLRQMPKSQWHKPAPASHIGDHTYVIRFTDQTGMQIRLFGHFHDPHDAFVMTFVGHEKDGKYIPEGYEALAQVHRANCSENFQTATQPYGNRCELCSRDTGSMRH